jgi:mannosyltransferase OCH1-like enzyme
MGEVIKTINKNESTAIETIPRIIIQVWVQKDGGKPMIPVNQVRYMNKFRELNPAFEHMFFNGDDIEQFFKDSKPKIIPTDDFDKKGYLTFWKEWRHLREAWK